MHRGGEAARSRPPWRVVGAALALVAAIATACGTATSEPSAEPSPSTGVATAAGHDLDDLGPAGADPTASSAGALGSRVDPAPLAVGNDATPADPADRGAAASESLEGFGTNPRSSLASGDGTALLRAVRVGRHAGFERIVFEFEGDTQPDYRVRWVEGPVTADGSGRVVDVEGPAHLEVVLSPASGVDPTDGSIVYDGADRVDVAEETVLVRDLVRTGDFEAVLTWAIGASHGVPFRVLTLQGPTRVVVDLRTPSGASGRS